MKARTEDNLRKGNAQLSTCVFIDSRDACKVTPQSYQQARVCHMV